ncbi:MAG TPA: HTTM domain-containing protein [Polyangiaceae bacterium]
MPLPSLGTAFDRLFTGAVAAWIYAWLRIGTAAIFLVRNTDWLRNVAPLEHHRFVRGLLFFDSTAAEPRLISPMIPGLTLDAGTSRALVYTRTVLAVLLLLGVRARASAALLALVSFSLFAADRYRYYHHLYLLYLTVAWLALTPIGAALSLEQPIRRALAAFRPEMIPRRSSWLAAEPVWPLQLVRALVIGVYFAAGVSKLDAGFLAGDALRELERFHVLKGTFWELTRDAVGYGGAATLSCFTEFALCAGLLLRPTRRVAVVFGWAFHAGISASMPVYTFGAQMSVLLLVFWPRAQPAFSRTDGLRSRH